VLLSGARIVVPGGLLEPGWLRVRNGRILAVGAGTPPAPDPGEEHRELTGRTVLPGFIDCHVHGGGGGAYTSAAPAEVRRAVAFHRSRGTTRTMASLVTAPVEDLLAALAPLAELTEEGLIAGVHLEGPFLSPGRCGAQDPRYLLEPDPELLDRFVAAGRGAVRMVTIAPELPGALDLVRRIVDAGAIAAIGHSDATYDEARAAVEAGATAATHLWNAMRPVHHRQPGIVGAALESDDLVCELIADGHHVHPAAILLTFRAAAGRVALITDAISAAGAADGLYRLGRTLVRVERGKARLEGGTSIAGSTIGTGDALRYAVRTAGVSLPMASDAISLVPARLLGIDGETGSLETGKAADLVVLDAELQVADVMCAGAWQPIDESLPLLHPPD
jgi:N-acetylglucosamine-6-phosphate deacetylase